MEVKQLLFVALLACAIGVAITAIAGDRRGGQSMTPATVQLPNEGEMPSFDGATEWLNSPPLTAADLRGKVIIVDFWTYTCINWRRQLPYVRAWAEKYKG